MNLFFDEVSQKLIKTAKKEMLLLKHPYVGSEHLLLAILHNDNLDITKELSNYGITYQNFRFELLKTVGIGSKENNWFLFTPLLKKIINNASYYSKENNAVVTPKHLLISILEEGDGIANRILLSMNIDIEALYDKFLLNKTINDKSTPILDSLGINMCEKALNNKYDPVIGREEIIDNIIQILIRKNKNNPLLIGEAGVGKTAIVEEVARRIALGRVTFKLKNKIIYSISMASLVAGTKYRGEFEERIQKLIKEIKDNTNIILFIDEVHTLMGAGGAEGAIDASNIMKPYLARGDIKVIGATTISEYQKFIKGDKALNRRFQTIVVKEAQKEEVKKILTKLKPIYQKYHHVKISNDILNSIIDLSYTLPGFKQPDKAIDLLDEVCSYTVIHNNKKDKELLKYEEKIKKLENKKNKEIMNHHFKKALDYKNKELEIRSLYNDKLFTYTNNKKYFEVGIKELENVIYNKLQIPIKNFKNSNLRLIKDNIKTKIKGLDNTIDLIVDKIKNNDYIKQNKPFSMLFIGKNVFIKPFLAEEIVKNIFKDTNLIHLKDFEYDNYRNIEMFYKNNYENYKQEKSIFYSIIEHPFSIIILDNIDKANKDFLEIFKDILETGYLKEFNNEKIDFRKTIIFMTSKEIDFKLGFIDNNNYFNNFRKLIKEVINVTEEEKC